MITGKIISGSRSIHPYWVEFGLIVIGFLAGL